MDKTIDRWTDPDGNGYAFKDTVARAQNREMINKISAETADRKAEVSTERKRIDNLIASGTAQTQEIGKTIVQTKLGSSNMNMDYLAADKYYSGLFDGITFKDTDFFYIPSPSGSGAEYVGKLLKPGLYHMEFCVKISKDGGLPEIAMRIMLKKGSTTTGEYSELKTEYIIFPQTSSSTNMRNVEYIFAITEPTYIKLFVTSIVDGTGTFGFNASECTITAIDWKGKQSADLSELHDLRIGADGTVYDTAGEAVRSQTSGTPKNLIPTSTKEFEALGITVKVKGHEFSLSGTATDNGIIRLINETTDTLGMITGKTYYVYGFPSGTRVTFLSGENVCGTMVLADTDNTFEVPEKADKLWFEVIVKYKDTLNYINTLKICDREYKTYQEQIDEANAKIETLQAIIVNAVKAQQTASIKAVADEGTQQVTAVNAAGSTQVSTIETKGADQVKTIQEAGENALQNISDGVDKGLSEEGKAADAKATGGAISKLTEDTTKSQKQIELLQQQIADMQYVPIEILSFTNNVNIAELGSSVNEINLTWKLNKSPKSATLNNVSVSGELETDQSVTIRDAALTTDSIFTLAVTDEKNKTAQKKSSIAFYNGIYYGSAIIPTKLDSAFIRALNKSLQKDRVKTFTINSGVDQYVWYALPTRYGEPVFNVGGFDGGFAKISEISFENTSGYTEEYTVYRSDNSNLGMKTIKVI